MNRLEFLCLFLGCFFVTQIDSRSVHDDIATIRQRVLSMVIWPDQNSIPHVVQLALEYNRTMNASCYWQDINYADKTLADWSTEQHLVRVNFMIQALTAPGSSVQNETTLAIAAHCALNVWLERDWLNPNWWFNQIGVPLLATGQLLMLGESATVSETEKIKEISFRADWWAHDPGTGANLIWMIQIQLYRSLATNNRTGVEQGFTRMWKDIAVLPLGGQGIQSDWSYHFHGTQLLSAAYGQDWIMAMLIFVLCSENTPYELQQDQLIILAKFLTEGDAWMIIDNLWDWQVFGRAIDRPETIFNVDFSSNWIRSLASLVIGDDIKQNLYNFADRLDRKPDAAQLIGNRHFYTSDYQVHRRTNWTSTMKMQSIRTQPTECINGENQQGEHLGQGVLNIYTTNPADYRQIFPLLDWHLINGITVEYDVPIEPCNRGLFDWIKTNFVGGVSDGLYGSAMMDTATHNLTGKRSWHFYDQAIIALASRLTTKSQNRARTTLASRLLSQGTITVAFFNGTKISLIDHVNYTFPYSTINDGDNVRWIHISESNVGYLFENQGFYSNIGAEISTKTRSYSTIGPYNTTITARTVILWIDHGVGPYINRDYSYIIVPTVTLESMASLVESYAEEKIFSCISNNDLLHGTAWPSLQRASFTLWDNLTTIFICSSPQFSLRAQISDAGTYLFNETASAFSITVAHPTRINGYLNVNVNRLGRGDRCLPQSDGTTNITIPLPSSSQYLGMSITVTCQKDRAKKQHLLKYSDSFSF